MQSFHRDNFNIGSYTGYCYHVVWANFSFLPEYYSFILTLLDSGHKINYHESLLTKRNPLDMVV